MKKAILYTLCFIYLMPSFAQNNVGEKIKLMIPAGHGSDIKCVGMSDDGKYLASIDKSTLNIWDIAKEVKLYEINPPSSIEKVYKISFNTDNSHLLISTEYKVFFLDIKTQKIVFEKDAQSANYSADKKQIYLFDRGYSGTIFRILDAVNGNMLKEIRDLPKSFENEGNTILHEINNGKEILIANRNGFIRLDLASSKVVKTIEYVYPIYARTEDKMVHNLFLPKNNTIIGWNGNQIAIYDALTGELIKKWKLKNNLRNLVFDEKSGLTTFSQDNEKSEFLLLEQLDPSNLTVQKSNYIPVKKQLTVLFIAPSGVSLPSQNKIFFASQNNLAVVDNSKSTFRLAFNSTITTPNYTYPTADGTFAFRSTDNAIRFINPNTYKPTPIYPQEIGGKLLSRDKKTLVEIVNGYNVEHKIIVSDVEKGKVLNSWKMPDNLPKDGSSYTDFYFAEGNQKLIYIHNDSAFINVFDLKTGKNASIHKGIGYFYKSKLSADKKYIAFINARRNGKAKNTFKVFDVIKNKIILEKEYEPSTFCFIDNETKIAYRLGGDDAKKTSIVDFVTGVETTFDATNIFSLVQNKEINSIELSDLKGSNSKIKLKNTEGGIIAQFALQNDGSYVNSDKISPDNKALYTFGSKKDLTVTSTLTKKLVGSYYFLENSKDWVFVAPNGLFDGTEKAMKELYFVKNFQTIALDNLFEKCFTPNLITRLLNGEILPDPQLDNLKSVPIIKIKLEGQQRNLVVENDVPEYNATTEKVKLTLVAEAKDDAIAEIKLFHNGKIVGSGTRNLVVEDDKLEKTKTQVFDIQLVEGENRFKAIALNSQRTESQPDEIMINFKAVETPPSGAGGLSIQLHLVIVGINKYKNPKYNLNYATADATSFKEAIEKGGTSIFSKTNVVFIGDEKATKAGISDELEKVKAAAKPQDVFIFYYAGHGVLNQKKDFFLVPHDVTQLYGQDDALAQKGLSANQLQQFSKDIKAQKQLFILDACQSAGALDQIVAARGAAEEKAIAQLARATGTHWLTASGSEQFASEFTQLGHGTFTYVLLEALSGKADKGGDKKITVKELDAYLQEVVPELTAKYKGTPQYPASYGFGNDFPIGVVKQ